MFDYQKFMPHGYCFLWQPDILWLHVISDAVIGLSYFSIPFALFYFIRKRKDLQYKWIFHLFAMFIFWCGLTHFMNILVIWIPDYPLQGLVKAATAGVSLVTAVLLWPLLPKALKLPSPKMLEDKNRDLERLTKTLELRVKEKVKDSERLAAIVNSSQEGIISKSIDGIVMSWNPAAEKIFQYTAEEMIGRSIFTIVPENKRAEENELIRKISCRESVAPFETVRRRKDGSAVEVSIAISPICDENGQIIALSSIFRDITQKRHLDVQLELKSDELKERNRQLVNANKAKDEFISNLSHELRSPLNIILGYSELMDNYPPGSQEYRMAVDVIKRNAKTQLRLIEDLLDMSRIISGKFSLSVASHNLNDIVDQSIKAVEFAARSKNISIKKVDKITPPASQVIVCDADRLQQVLWNLLTNAVKFTNPSGDVTILTEREAGDFIIEVRDNGRGIDRQDLPHIFDRLWQTGEAHNGQQGGLGLGLKISKDLVEAHGGYIAADSKGLGTGAVFRVHIPIQAVVPDKTDETVQKIKKPLEGLRVLVVDDSPDAVELIRIVLNNAGATVVTAANGAEALELIRQNNIQFIISDINMPIMDGYSFMENTRIVENNKAKKNRPAIALTARTGPGEKERAYRSGFQLHLIKPVQPSILVEKVLSVLHAN